MAYVNFVNHCYVDTEVEMKEIYTSNHIWKLFEDFTVDMARVTVHAMQVSTPPGGPPGFICFSDRFLQVCNKREKRLSDPILEKYIINVVFDTINAFFSSPFSENSTSLQVRTTRHRGHCSCVTRLVSSRQSDE